MTVYHTGILALPYPDGNEEVSLGPTDFQDIVQILDSGTTSGPVITRVITGTLAQFTTTAASSVPFGTFFEVTDVDAMFFRTAASTWRAVTGFQSGVATARPAAAGTGSVYYATDTKIASLDVGTWISVAQPVTFVQAASDFEPLLNSIYDIYNGFPLTATLPEIGTSPGYVTIIAASNAGSLSGTAPLSIVPSGTDGFEGSGAGNYGNTEILLGTPGAYVTLYGSNGLWKIVAGQIDTGWIPAGPIAGVATGAAPDANQACSRVQADTASIIGYLQNFTGGTIASGTTIATLDESAWPDTTWVYLGALDSASGWSIMPYAILPSGVIQPYASFPNGAFFFLSAQFPVAF